MALRPCVTGADVSKKRSVVSSSRTKKSLFLDFSRLENETTAETSVTSHPVTRRLKPGEQKARKQQRKPRIKVVRHGARDFYVTYKVSA
jgi:hypothetical protein